eukprot:1158041-Pelagomonas_calceolata.AAC.3
MAYLHENGNLDRSQHNCNLVLDMLCQLSHRYSESPSKPCKQSSMTSYNLTCHPSRDALNQRQTGSGTPITHVPSLQAPLGLTQGHWPAPLQQTTSSQQHAHEEAGVRQDRHHCTIKAASHVGMKSGYEDVQNAHEFWRKDATGRHQCNTTSSQWRAREKRDASAQNAHGYSEVDATGRHHCTISKQQHTQENAGTTAPPQAVSNMHKKQARGCAKPA